MMKLKIVALIIALLVAAASITFFMYNKPHRDIRSADPDFTTSVGILMHEFGTNEQAAYEKYSGKVMLVRGRIESVTNGNDPAGILLKDGEFRANCEMDSLFNIDEVQLTAGDSVNMKGLFVGFDDLLGELQLKKCIIEK
jgi:hypothetical protein